MNAKPVLGVVYAPVTNDRGPDCIAWCQGLGGIYRNGQLLTSSINHRQLEAGSKVLVSTGALTKPKINEVLCAPAEYRPMPSIAYRLATAAAGDGVAAVSIAPVSAHDVVAGHAILRGAGGVLVDQIGEPITYESEAKLSKVSTRCFGGAPQACAALAGRDWGRVFA
jgi:myo-inositol-1(or 4)-monophosphatase